MSRIPIDRDHDLAHLVPDGETAFEVTGEDRVVFNIAAVDDEPMQTKSARLPLALVAAAENVAHPQGFSGIMREALAEWLTRHTGGTDSEIRDVEQALAVLQRAAADLRAAHRDVA